MGKPSREKGARAERELAALLPGGVKVSRAWDAGTDVEWMGRVVEVKRRATPISSTLHKYLADSDIVATRADRDGWHVYLTLDTLLDLMDEARLGER